MLLRILFGQRDKKFGAGLPEVLAYFESDMTPEEFKETCAGARSHHDSYMSSMRVIDIEVDGDLIAKLLNESPVVKGEIKG